MKVSVRQYGRAGENPRGRDCAMWQFATESDPADGHRFALIANAAAD